MFASELSTSQLVTTTPNSSVPQASTDMVKHFDRRSTESNAHWTFSGDFSTKNVWPFLYLVSMCSAAFRHGLVYADKQDAVTVYMCVGFVLTEFSNLQFRRLGALFICKRS